MSLRTFHIFFITLAMIAALSFGEWALGAFRVGKEVWGLVASLVSYAVVAGLLGYLGWFLIETDTKKNQ